MDIHRSGGAARPSCPGAAPVVGSQRGDDKAGATGVLKHRYAVEDSASQAMASFVVDRSLPRVALAGAHRNPARVAFLTDRKDFDAAVEYAEGKREKAARKGEKDGVPAWKRTHWSENVQARLDGFSRAVRCLVTGKDKGGNLIDLPRAAIMSGTGSALAVIKPAVNEQVVIHVGAAAGKISAAAGTAAGLPFGLIGGASAGKDVVDLLSRKHRAVRTMIDCREGAQRHVADPGNSRPEDKLAFLNFMEASQKIPKLKDAARQDKVRTYVGAAQSGAGLLPGAASANASAIAKAVTVLPALANAALSVVGSVCGIFSGAVQIFMGQGDYARASGQRAGIKEKKAALERWAVKLPGDPVMQKIQGTVQSSLERIARHGVRERGFAIFKIAKGVLDIGVGATGGAFALGALAGLSGATLATGGLALAITATLIGTIYAGAMLSKMYMKWKSDYRAKDRQRQAHELILKSGGDAARLEDAFGAAQRETLTIARAGGKQKVKRVEIATNEYVALHLLAVRISKDGDAVVAAGTLLTAIGMQDFDLQTVLGAAQTITDGKQRLEFIKKQIAPVLGMTYRPNLKTYAEKAGQAE